MHPHARHHRVVCAAIVAVAALTIIVLVVFTELSLTGGAITGAFVAAAAGLFPATFSTRHGRRAR